MAVYTRGERELALRFDTFPTRLHAKLADRIAGLTSTLEARVQRAEPFKTGKLRGETVSRVYADNPDRVAGYVEISAPGQLAMYLKAATLEYGTDKVRRRSERATGLLDRLGRGHRQLVDRVTKPVHIEAFRYLRASLEGMQSEVDTELSAALDETAQEGG